MKKLLAMSLLLSSIAYGKDYECKGLDNKNVLRIVKEKVQVYEIHAVRVNHGDFITLKEVGHPILVKVSSDKFRQTFSGENFELITKADRGIITHSDHNFIEDHDYACGEYNPSQPPRPVQPKPCMPGRCR